MPKTVSRTTASEVARTRKQNVFEVYAILHYLTLVSPNETTSCHNVALACYSTQCGFGDLHPSIGCSPGTTECGSACCDTPRPPVGAGQFCGDPAKSMCCSTFSTQAVCSDGCCKSDCCGLDRICCDGPDKVCRHFNCYTYGTQDECGTRIPGKTLPICKDDTWCATGTCDKGCCVP